MDEEEVMEFAVRGVVRDGQVVLDVPLTVPDGTVVTVKKYHPSDYSTVLTPPTEDQLRWLRADIERLRAEAKERAARPSGGQEAA